MPLYLCRWPNSDVSVVQARNKTEAIIRLDEFENAEDAQITRLTDFVRTSTARLGLVLSGSARPVGKDLESAL